MNTAFELILKEIPHIFELILPVFLIIGLGYLSVKAGIFKKEDTTIFTKYDYYFAFPILIFYLLETTNLTELTGSNTGISSQLPNFIWVNIIALALTLIFTLVSGKLLKFPNKFIAISAFAAVFGNVAYMGIPVINSLFPNNAAAGSYTGLIIAIASVFCLSVSIFVLEMLAGDRPKISKIILNLFKNPIVIACLAGSLALIAKEMHFFTLILPQWLNKTLVLVKDSASPIALFSIGMFLVGKKLKGDFSKILFVTLINMILLPIMVVLASMIFKINNLSLQISVIEAAMPLAATTFVIAQRYKLFDETISSAVLLSTLLSVITLPLTIALLNFIK